MKKNNKNKGKSRQKSLGTILNEFDKLKKVTKLKKNKKPKDVASTKGAKAKKPIDNEFFKIGKVANKNLGKKTRNKKENLEKLNEEIIKDAPPGFEIEFDKKELIKRKFKKVATPTIKLPKVTPTIKINKKVEEKIVLKKNYKTIKEKLDSLIENVNQIKKNSSIVNKDLKTAENTSTLTPKKNQPIPSEKIITQPLKATNIKAVGEVSINELENNKKSKKATLLNQEFKVSNLTIILISVAVILLLISIFVFSKKF